MANCLAGAAATGLSGHYFTNIGLKRGAIIGATFFATVAVLGPNFTSLVLAVALTHFGGNFLIKLSGESQINFEATLMTWAIPAVLWCAITPPIHS